MKTRALLVSGVLATALASLATAASAQTTRPPNIVVIMTDDVGWGDLGSYGGGAMRGAPTPNLDRLASEGMRFVNYYGQASCTAGRASFITGRIPIRTSLSAVLAPGDLHDGAAWQMACRRPAGELPNGERLRRDDRHASLLCRRVCL
jgi:arylsulfatase